VLAFFFPPRSDIEEGKEKRNKKKEEEGGVTMNVIHLPFLPGGYTVGEEGEEG